MPGPDGGELAAEFVPGVRDDVAAWKANESPRQCVFLAGLGIKLWVRSFGEAFLDT